MSKIYTYCLRYDSGAAPNPFGGICTLAICKPAIRKNAEIGDWIVGTGSKNSPIGDISNKVVYVMKVTRKMKMEEYDDFTRKELSVKIPNHQSADLFRQCGDSIYDFSTIPSKIRQSVHSEKNRDNDLSGQYVLLSDHFFYFGSDVKFKDDLPLKLQAIIKDGPGYRSRANSNYVAEFLTWIESLGRPQGGRPPDPLLWLEEDCQTILQSCAAQHCKEAEEDEVYELKHSDC